MSTRKKVLFYEHNDAFSSDKILGKFLLADNHLKGTPHFLAASMLGSVEAALQTAQTSGIVSDLLGEEVRWKVIKE